MLQRPTLDKDLRAILDTPAGEGPMVAALVWEIQKLRGMLWDLTEGADLQGARVTWEQAIDEIGIQPPDLSLYIR